MVKANCQRFWQREQMATDVNITSKSSDTVDLIGLNNIHADVTLNLPQPFKTEGVNTYDIKPLTTNSNATIELKPLSADLKIEPLSADLKIEPLSADLKIEPLKTDSNITLDLKPVVLDLCLTANIGKVPNLCIRQPYRHRFGFTLFGVEVWGLSLSGEQETVVDELSPRPQIAATGNTVWPPAKPAAAATVEPQAAGGGLRIRLGS
jgi:hypothetical protein